MKEKREKRKGAIPQVPVHGNAAHNAAFLVSIGNLVVHWANNESVFLAMLQVLLEGGELSAAVVWHSHRTSVARVELVYSLCRERVKDAQLLTDIGEAIASFKKLSRTRNFYCHATYRYDEDLHLASASGVTVTQDGSPLNFTEKKMELAALHEMSFVTMQLTKLNGHLWDLVGRLQKELGVQRVTLPPPLSEQK